jgi:uncharacterized membrane protein YdjX (TVP38/TMEM64 family)
VNRTPPGGGTWPAVAVTLGGIAAGVVLVFAISPLRDAVFAAIRGDTETVREDVRNLDAWGVVLVVALGLAHAVIWYPAEILDAAAGFVYGFGPAMPLVMFAWVLNGLASYAIGVNAGRPLIYRLAGEERFNRMEGMVADGGVTLLLAMRLIPIVPFSLFSIAAGAARVPLWRFTWTTTVGYLPITAMFVYLGSRLEELSLTDPLVLASAAALIAMLLAVRWIKPRLEGDAEKGRPDGGP